MAEPDPVTVEQWQQRVAANRARVQELITAAGGDASAIRIVAVTKGFGPDAARGAVAAGLTDLGESYAQELVAKAPALADEPRHRWHFIGNLQTNKVKALAAVVTCWQSIDRAAQLDELARRAPGAVVFVQVDVHDDPRKGGAPPGVAADLVRHGRDLDLQVDGVMAVGVAGDDDATRASFAAAAALADRFELPVRSFGMTADLALAVREGTTMIRIGTALFGERPPPR